MDYMNNSELGKLYKANFNNWASESGKITHELEKELDKLRISEESYSKITSCVYDSEFVGFQQGVKYAFRLLKECIK